MRITAILFILILGFVAKVASQQVVHTVYLIGDAGKNTSANKTLLALQSELEKETTGTVIFLGDNIYPAGLVSKKDEAKLLAQLQSVSSFPGNVMVIPGNHDWKQGLWKGLSVLRNEEKFVQDFFTSKGVAANNQSRTFSPTDGLPGPYTMLLADGIRLITLDTQWWLHSQFFHKTNKPTGLTRKQTSERCFKALDSLLVLSDSLHQKVIIAAHHPLFSMGHHGRPKQPLRFLVNWTPFQVFGLIGLNRMLVQDIPQPRYQKLKKRLLRTMYGHKNIIYAAGHEHTLQYFLHNNNHFLVSGAGSKVSSIEHTVPEAKFLNGLENGFMKLEFTIDGHVQLKVWGATSGWNLYEKSLY